MQSNFAHGAKIRTARKFAQWAKIRAARKFAQCTKISAALENFTHARISSASHFCPFCIFSNFTPDVILMSSYVYVISFVTEHYISLVKLVANQSIWTETRLLVPVFPLFFFSPIFFHFLSIQTRLDDDKSRHAWLKPLHP